MLDSVVRGGVVFLVPQVNELGVGHAVEILFADRRPGGCDMQLGGQLIELGLRDTHALS